MTNTSFKLTLYGCVVSACVGFASLDGMLVCISFLICVCMLIVSKALLISSATVIFRAVGGGGEGYLVEPLCYGVI